MYQSSGRELLLRLCVQRQQGIARAWVETAAHARLKPLAATVKHGKAVTEAMGVRLRQPRPVAHAPLPACALHGMHLSSGEGCVELILAAELLVRDAFASRRNARV